MVYTPPENKTSVGCIQIARPKPCLSRSRPIYLCNLLDEWVRTAASVTDIIIAAGATWPQPFRFSYNSRAAPLLLLLSLYARSSPTTVHVAPAAVAV